MGPVIKTNLFVKPPKKVVAKYAELNSDLKAKIDDEIPTLRRQRRRRVAFSNVPIVPVVAAVASFIPISLVVTIPTAVALEAGVVSHETRLLRERTRGLFFDRTKPKDEKHVFDYIVEPSKQDAKGFQITYENLAAQGLTRYVVDRHYDIQFKNADSRWEKVLAFLERHKIWHPFATRGDLNVFLEARNKQKRV